MKKIISLLFIVFSLGFSTFAFSYVKCVNMLRITELEAGRLSSAPGGEDSGNAVMVKFEGNKYFYLPNTQNMNDSSGRAMFSILQMAATLNLPVDAWGYNNQCSDGLYHVKAIFN